jgi:hypothetical protein
MTAMKNVTITLDEKTAAWARKHAAQNDTSLSRFVGQLLETTMRESREYERSMREYLAREPVPLRDSSAPYPSRDQLYDRGRLR